MNDKIELKWKSVSDLHDEDNPKKRGWLVLLKDYDAIKSGSVYNKEVSLSINNQEPEIVIFSNFTYTKPKKLRDTLELMPYDEEGGRLTPVIYRKKSKYKPKTSNSVPPKFYDLAGIMRHGYIYVAFTYKGRITLITSMNIFTIIE